MAILLLSPEPSDALRTAREWFRDFDDRVTSQRVFDAVKHRRDVRILDSAVPRFVKGETNNEGAQR